MSDDESGMAAVLGEAIEKAMEDDSIETVERFASVLAVALAEAGYGHVGQTRVETWDDGYSAKANEEMLRTAVPSTPLTPNPYRTHREADARCQGCGYTRYGHFMAIENMVATDHEWVLREAGGQHG